MHIAGRTREAEPVLPVETTSKHEIKDKRNATKAPKCRNWGGPFVLCVRGPEEVGAGE